MPSVPRYNTWAIAWQERKICMTEAQLRYGKGMSQAKKMLNDSSVRPVNAVGDPFA